MDKNKVTPLDEEKLPGKSEMELLKFTSSKSETTLQK
jgi:hypothetical protein